MRRTVMTPRPAWRDRCDQVGFSFYDLESEGGRPYWNESAAYVFSLPEIELIESATKELFDRCMDAVEMIVRRGRFAEFGIPERFHDLVRTSWDQDDPTVYGRFDLAYDGAHVGAGTGTVQLLEFNADTPTSLVETAAAQWQWLDDLRTSGRLPSGVDQFNEVHERLIEQWEHIRAVRWRLPAGSRLHLASLHDAGDGRLIVEDFDTVAYMAETAKAAGFSPKLIFMEDVRWSMDLHRFVDADDEPVEQIFKLYPWEWMMTEKFGGFVPLSRESTRWIEPAWKLLLSNKQLLVVLWEMFPGHPNLLPAFTSAGPLLGRPHVSKPRLGREGANVTMYDARRSIVASQAGPYGKDELVYQQQATFPLISGKTAVIGSWIVGETPVGIDIRETSGPITGDLAEFVPHYIEESP